MSLITVPLTQAQGSITSRFHDLSKWLIRRKRPKLKKITRSNYYVEKVFDCIFDFHGTAY